MKIKIVSIFILILLAYFLVNILYFYQKNKERVIISIANYTLEDCKKVNFKINKIICENKTIKVSIFNSGNIELIGDFLGIIYTPNFEALIGTSPKESIKINQTSVLTFDLGKSALVKKIEIVFQPCSFSTKLIENLSIQC
jgi:hypothetical protein